MLIGGAIPTNGLGATGLTGKVVAKFVFGCGINPPETIPSSGMFRFSIDIKSPLGLVNAVSNVSNCGDCIAILSCIAGACIGAVGINDLSIVGIPKLRLGDIDMFGEIPKSSGPKPICELIGLLID